MMTPKAKATFGDRIRKWWFAVTGAVASVLFLGAMVWATSGEQADTLRRVKTLETQQSGHADTDGHDGLSRRVTEQGAHMIHLKERADRADSQRDKILRSVNSLESSSARVEALLESLDRRPIVGPGK